MRDETEYGERIAPGSLTFAIAEGLTTQTGMIHGTGLAFVGLQGMRLFRPVKVGDTIGVDIEVLESRRTKSRNAGIVRCRHLVKNQRGETVMDYTCGTADSRQGDVGAGFKPACPPCISRRRPCSRMRHHCQ